MLKRNALALLVALTLIFTAAFAAAEAPTPEPKPSTNADGKPYLLDAFEGTPLDVSLYEGKALFLNFFTGWCPYCMDEMPEIKQIFDDFDPEQIEIVLVHVWDGEDGTVTDEVRERFGMEDMTFVEDERGMLTTIFGVPGYPASLFIDAEGYFSGSAARALDYDTMAAYLTAMGVEKSEKE